MNWSEIFEYQDGNLIWKIDNHPNKVKGKIAGTINNTGYYRLKYNGKKYLNHRIIYEMHYNTLPEFLDHIDKNRLNNKIENLRSADRYLNAFNREYKNRGDLPKGVYKYQKSYTVNICGKYKGSFKTLEEALIVRQEFERLKMQELVHHGQKYIRKKNNIRQKKER